LSVPPEPKTISPSAQQPVLFCFSHLRWNFVFQRPQHLMSRFARTYRVLYWEEPVVEPGRRAPALDRQEDSATGVVVVTPKLPEGLDAAATEQALRALLQATPEASGQGIVRLYYTPMMLPFSRGLAAARTVYDCMDELSNFKFAPSELVSLERELLAVADVVFTGGYSIWEAKKHAHANIHPFPSSVDKAHFAVARGGLPEPADQADLPHPRLGFYGVIDERLDVDLLAAVADAHPEWSLIIVGPVVKIDPATLPRRANLHFLGGKAYAELPAYLAEWDVALMPFAINDATRFISPTKTPEYLAAGRPVVSTAIRDVVRHWGETPGVIVAENAAAFIAGCETGLALAKTPDAWLPAVDAALADLSWDKTYEAMAALVAPQSRVVELPVKPSRPARPYDYLIVGAGFAGAVLAERLAAGSGKRVLLIDRRPHVGGNAFDHHDEAGLLVHKYGPHIFHTNSTEIAAYLSRFTRWRPYEHRVLAEVRDKLVPIPINRTTLNSLYDLDLASDADAEAYLRSRAEPTPSVRTSEDVVVSAVGRELYELFFRGYTRKQWGLDPSELDKSVTARVPTRTNTDDRYFTDSFQAMPAAGYTAMFERMLDHPKIEVRTGVDFEHIGPDLAYDHLIFCGPIDEYFDHRFGKLPYRSLRFEHTTLDQARFQPVATVNYPSEAVPFTRITEFKQLTGQSHAKTSIVHEYPEAEGDPYYPVPRPENQALFKRYEALAMTTPGVTFVGRLATYRYYNMDQVVGQALATWRRLANAGAGEAARAVAATPAA
jgi:UDP-galactopyranose mutase